MTAQPAIRKLDHVGIMVTNIDSAVAWYSDALGLTVTDRWENEEAHMAWAHLEGEGFRVELVERQQLIPPAPSGSGYHHLCLEVDNCEEATKALQTAGGTTTMAPARFERHSMTWSFVEDPFGNTIELVAYDPAEQTRRSAGTNKSRSVLS